MSWGSTTSTQSNQSQNGNSASVPVQADWVAALQKSLGGSASSLVQQAGMPVFGSAQKSTFLNDLNSNTDASRNGIASQLASRGALNSGAVASSFTNLDLNRNAQISNYNTQTPLLNQQAQQSNLARALTTAGGISSLAPTGQLTSSSQTGSSNSTQTQSPGFGSLLGGLLGFGLSALTGGSGGLAGLMGQSPGLGTGVAPGVPSLSDIYGSDSNLGQFGGYGPPQPPTWASSR